MEEPPVAHPAPLRHPGIPHGLRGQIMLMASVLLGMACLTLGGLFFHQQIVTVTDGLHRSGRLLGENLAANSRYSLVSGDRDELTRLAREILSVDDVSYVLIFSPEGRPLVTIGKGQWEQLLTTSHSVVSPINPALTSLRLDTPAVGEVHLMNGHATFSPSTGYPLACILTLLVGREMGLFHDIGVPVYLSASTAARDSSLQLLFEQQDDPVQTADTPPRHPLGIVEVGMSSLLVQEQIRNLIWQAIGITVLILALSLLLLSFFSHHITIPLRRLTDAANRAAAGEAQVDLRSAAQDEIGDLTRVFSHMLHSIQDRETALQNLNHTLESRIAARTEELRLANGKLQELDHRKSLFVSTASHEIKTPLTSITCHLDNLLMGVDGTLAKEHARVIERVQVNIGRLQHLLVDLLDLCKIELGEATVELDAVNLATVVTQAIESMQSLAAQKDVLLDAHLPTTLPLVAADAAKLHQIVTNLLHNALKFSPNHGTVRITGQPADGGFVRIAVQDSGCGIAREEMERIFEPFYCSKHIPMQTRGTGLGLPIAKQLVELHRGRLWVNSEVGHGACFFFTLPIWVEAHPDADRHDEPALASKHSSPFGSPDSSRRPA